MMATLWIQNAAEVKALDYQAYNIATKRLSLLTRRKVAGKRLAVILDIDETVLDNSPYQARNIIEQRSYTSENWGEWIQKRMAQSLPGVSDFIRFAHDKGVEVFLVSNRKIKHLEDTYQNLVDRGIQVKRENIFLRTTSNSKLSRRKTIEKKFNVVMLFGDTLADFHEDFEEASKKERDMLVEKYRDEFGKKYFILPNPMYGEWINSLYHYEESLTGKEREKIHYKNLYPYE